MVLSFYVSLTRLLHSLAFGMLNFVALTIIGPAVFCERFSFKCEGTPLPVYERKNGAEEGRGAKGGSCK